MQSATLPWNSLHWISALLYRNDHVFSSEIDRNGYDFRRSLAMSALAAGKPQNILASLLQWPSPGNLDRIAVLEAWLPVFLTAAASRSQSRGSYR